MFCHVSWGRSAHEAPGRFGCWDLHMFSPRNACCMMLYDAAWCMLMCTRSAYKTIFFQNIVVAVCECSACTAFQIRFDWSLGKWKHVEIKRQVIGIRMESETCPLSCHWCGAYQRGDGYIWFPVGSQLPLGETNRHFVRPFHFGCHRCHRRVTMISLSFDVTISAWIQTWRLTTGDDDFAYWRATSATWLKHVETCRNMLKHVET